MTPAHESPAFPSVGARARFHQSEFEPMLVTITRQFNSMPDFWTVTDDLGRRFAARADELSPLPAAPQNEETNG